MADEDILFLDQNEDGDRSMTSEEIIESLQSAWLNEKFAPEILHHNSEIVDCVLQQINNMQENLERVKVPDIKFAIHRLETERIRFMLSSYVRERIHKIEHFCSDILHPENKEEQKKLTQHELEFAQEYQSNLHSYLEDAALKNMPQGLQEINLNEMRDRPNMMSYVFAKVNKPVKNVHIDGDMSGSSDLTIDLEPGNQHLVMYNPIKNILKSGDVSLM